MYKISDEEKSCFMKYKTQTVTIKVSGVEGNLVLTEQDIMKGTLSIDRYTVSSEKIEIGSAIASELTFNLNNTDGRFDDFVFEGAELFVTITLKNNDIIYKIPMGYFTIDLAPHKYSIMSISALDRMRWFDQLVDRDKFVNDLTVGEYINRCCELCDVVLETALSSLPNYDYIIHELPDDDELTYRTLIQHCAELMGTCAYIDWNGHLRFEWYSTQNAGITIEAQDRYNSDMYDTDVQITGVICTDDDGNEYLSGSSDYTLDISDNPLLWNNYQSVVDAIGKKVNGFYYRPYSCETKPLPHLYPMDSLTFIDKNGKSHYSIITNYTFKMNAHTKIEGKAETATSNQYYIPRKTQQQSTIWEQAEKETEAMKSLVEEATLKAESAERVANEKAALLLDLNTMIGNAYGLHRTEIVTENGGSIYYFHDGESLDESNIIYTMNEKGFAFAYEWKGDNTEWKYGITSSGNAILNYLSVNKLTADYIDVSTITVTKSININNKFKVDEYGNAVLAGSITWGMDNSPVKALYNRTGTYNPSDGVEWDSYPENYSSQYNGWHRTFNSNYDYFGAYSYDGGNTWTTAIRVQGTNGVDGVGIGSVSEYYLLNNDSTAPSTEDLTTWTDSADTSTTSDKQYLWNCEVITNTNGKVITTTTPHIISKYVKDGKEVSKVTEYYGSSVNSTLTPTKWYNLLSSVSFDTSNKYLWENEVTTYTDGSTTSNTHIIAAYGDKGDPGDPGGDGSTVQTVYLYYLSDSSSAPSTTPSYKGGSIIPTGWSLTPSELTSTNKYEFISQCTVTDGEYGAWSTPVLWAKYGSDADVTSENVFNALTDNGTMFGCFYKQDGKLYINTEYLKSGTISSDLVFAGDIVAEQGTIAGLRFTNVDTIENGVPTKNVKTLASQDGNFQIESEAKYENNSLKAATSTISVDKLIARFIESKDSGRSIDLDFAGTTTKITATWSNVASVSLTSIDSAYSGGYLTEVTVTLNQAPKTKQNLTILLYNTYLGETYSQSISFTVSPGTTKYYPKTATTIPMNSAKFPDTYDSAGTNSIYFENSDVDLNNIAFQSNLLPRKDNNFSLGDSNYKWKSVFAKSAEFTSLKLNGVSMQNYKFYFYQETSSCASDYDFNISSSYHNFNTVVGAVMCPRGTTSLSGYNSIDMQNADWACYIDGTNVHIVIDEGTLKCGWYCIIIGY